MNDAALNAKDILGNSETKGTLIKVDGDHVECPEKGKIFIYGCCVMFTSDDGKCPYCSGFVRTEETKHLICKYPIK